MPAVPEKGVKPPIDPVAPVETPPAHAAGPRNPPSYEPAEVGKALKAAHDSFGCPACDSTGFVVTAGKKEVCSVCKGHPSMDITPAAYENLCRLAEVLTFVKDSAATREQTKGLGNLLAVAANPARVDKIVQSAAALLARADAKGGILLAGTVTAVGVQGSMHGAAVRMDGQDKPVSVLSGRSLAMNKDDKVLILGHLVRDPAKNLAGYTGTQPVVVWAILALKLP